MSEEGKKTPATGQHLSTESFWNAICLPYLPVPLSQVKWNIRLSLLQLWQCISLGLSRPSLTALSHHCWTAFFHTCLMYYWGRDSVPSTLSLCRPKGSLKDLFKHSTWEGKGANEWGCPDLTISGLPGTILGLGTLCVIGQSTTEAVVLKYFMNLMQTSWAKTPGLRISTAWQNCDLFNTLWLRVMWHGVALGENPQTKQLPDMQIRSSEGIENAVTCRKHILPRQNLIKESI